MFLSLNVKVVKIIHKIPAVSNHFVVHVAPHEAELASQPSSRLEAWQREFWTDSVDCNAIKI